MKLGSLIKILLLIIVIIDFYFLTSKFDWNDTSGFIFFISFSILFTVIILPLEILIILGFRKIFQYKKFSWIRLIVLLPASIEIYRSTIQTIEKTTWHGLNEHHLIAILWIMFMFLYRYNYILISSRKIKYQGPGGMYDSIKIKWDTVINVNKNDKLIEIVSDDEKLEINIDKIRKKQLPLLIRLIDENVKSTGHNTR
ncbi:hypothetical protein ACE01N_19740 [Saccharicrinis sp. FJH2]|uniref:hypothetical protein n=1 Tax=Saccharicrinis sp. FJH65 TaxID=3344659 RepID=UPI0035F23363